MYYIIDGYNLIFSLVESRESLKVIRQKVIRDLQVKFAKKKISGMLVFDGAHRREEESGLSYPSPLIVAYAPKGQSADEYIVEQLESSKHPKTITVVTNDRGLTQHARAAGSKVLKTIDFIEWLHKQKGKRKPVEPKETQENIDRLLKIFEKRFNELDDN